MKLRDIISAIESFAPPALQESYDNVGLIVGDPGMEISASLLCIDVTEAVLDEAMQKGANLVISHHPVIFRPLKRITGSSLSERIVYSAISGKIALYCAHTNIDNTIEGVNRKICMKLGLEHTKILLPLENTLKKLVTYVPAAKAAEVRSALFDAGAGNIGNYEACSFNSEGSGTFLAKEGSRPFVGKIGKLHFENETRIETIFPSYLKSRVIEALLKIHPYEEVAYDIYPVENIFKSAGSGMYGEIETPQDEMAFLTRLKEIFKCKMIRHTKFQNRPVKKVAVCGGSGSFLIPQATAVGADMFITGDIKYHQFFDAGKEMTLVDIGHYESEQFTIEIFYDILIKKMPNFAIHFSHINTNPIYYL